MHSIIIYAIDVKFCLILISKEKMKQHFKDCLLTKLQVGNIHTVFFTMGPDFQMVILNKCMDISTDAQRTLMQPT